MTRTQRRLTAELLEGRDVPATAIALGSPLGGFGNTLFRFDTATPGTLSTGVPVTGLAAGFNLIGSDFRPADGQLYGVAVNGDNVQVYTINPNTGAATAVGAAVTVSTVTGAVYWGVDFNPVADRIRVTNNLVSDGNAAGSNVNNFRLNPNDGTLASIDADLDFTAVPAAAPIVGVAYTNPDTDPATGTALFGIAAGNQSLVSLASSPAFNVVSSVGPLGVAADVLSDLDIYGPGNQTAAILDVGGLSQFATINLTTGAATVVGNIGNGTIDFADISVAPAVTPVVVSGTTDGKVTLLTPATISATPGQLSVGATVTAFANSTSNVRAASADVNQDGIPDLVLVTGPGTPIRVEVLSGADNSTVLVAPFDPFGGNFTGGGFVATGDFNNDGKADFVVTPDQGGGPRVSIFSRNADGSVATLANFLGIDDANFRGGARAAAGDVNGDGRPDLVVGAGFQGGPRVAIFNGTTLVGSTPTRLVGDFFAFPGTDATNLRNGVFVTASDINGDGFDDLVFGGGPGGAPRVFILDGKVVTTGAGVTAAQAAPIANFFVAGNSTDRGGVRLAAADLDGDGKGDLVVGSGEGNPAKVRAYLGANFTTTGEPTTFQDLSVLGGVTLANGVFVG